MFLCDCGGFVLWYMDDQIPGEPDLPVCRCGHPDLEHLYKTGSCTGLLVQTGTQAPETLTGRRTMNSIDREMIKEAADLLRRASSDANSGHFMGADWMAQTASWFERALGFRMLTVAEAAVPVTPPSTTVPEQMVQGQRWRPIDKTGHVSPDPAPETPDDPDEGETGPPEAQL